MNKLLQKYLISTAIGLAVVFAIALLRGVFKTHSAQEVIGCLMDGFFACGIVYIGVSLLAWISGEGLFLGLSYAVHSFFVVRNWSKTRFSERESYSDYREKKMKKRKPMPLFILLTGLAFVLVSVVLLVVYNLI